MLTLASASLIATTLTTYPGYGDRSIGEPRAAVQHPRVEAVIDRGPIAELVVRCRAGTAIVSYSKVEKLYCGPGGACAASLGAVVARACR